MFAKFYTDLEEAAQYYNSDNLEYDYEITPDHRVKSQNIILLSALCIFLFGSISRQKKQYNQIENGELTVGPANREKSIKFMSQACSTYLDWMKQDFEAELLIDFLLRERNASGGLVILKLSSDSDIDTTIPIAKDWHYIIVYEFRQEITACINSFVIRKTPINDLSFNRKLRFLNLIGPPNQAQNSMRDQSQLIHNYGFCKQGEVNCRLVERLQEPNSVRNSVLTENSTIQLNDTIVVKFEYFVVFGIKSGVDRFYLKLEEELSEIKERSYNRRDKIFKNLMFKPYKNLAEHYHKCQLYSVNNGDFIETLYHTSVEHLFSDKFMKNKNYQTIPVTPAIKAALKQPVMVSIMESTPDMIIYEDSEEEEMLTASPNLIQFLEDLNTKSQKGSSMKKQNEAQNPIPKPKVDFCSNIEVNQSNLDNIFAMTDTYKIQEEMNFKIDIGEHIRIINRVKKVGKVYLIFQNFAEFMQIQAIIDDPIDHRQIQRVLEQYKTQIVHEPKEIISINKETTIRLYPCTEEMNENKKKYFMDMLQTLKKQESFYIKTIACTYETMKHILSIGIFNFHINFAINQSFPQIECDSIFNQQTYASRVKVNKVQYEYFCQVKTDITNKDYKDPSNLRKEETALKEILKRNIHEYQIGDYLLNEVDEYNIAYMISEKLEKMYFILSKKPTEEFVYLTYHQKLLRIIRDKKGNFEKLEDALMRDISKTNEVVLRPTIQRAFLTGQKYIAINIPFEHSKLMKLQDITRLSYGNHNLVRYYLNKLKESQRYRLEIKPPCTTEYFEKVFAKQYVLRFDDKKIRSEIKHLELGFGNIEKWREKPFICMKADHYICDKVLKKWLLEYEGPSKSKD